MRAMIVLSLASLMACGGGNGGNGNNGGGNNGSPQRGPGEFSKDDMGVAADLAPSPDLAPPPPAAYPKGPYGNLKGKTLPNLALAGYRLTPAQTDSTKLTWDKTIRLSDYYNNPKCACMIITIGATWCGNCQVEQGDLINDVQQDPNFCVLGILDEGTQQQTPAIKTDVDDWTTMFNQNFTVALGTDQTQSLFNGYGDANGIIGLPFTLIVDPKTMKVTGNVQGYDPNIHTTACP